MKKKIIIVSIIVLFIGLLFVLIPYIKIDTGSKIIYLKYNDFIDKEYEENMCYHESVSYVKSKNISINKINIEKRFIFYLFTLEYVHGNLCDTEYVLEESYIEDFINNAKITYNSHNLDIEKLIEGKTAIVSNTRYLGNEYDTFIDFKLDGRYEIMYIFYKDDLLIIQVGSADESTKFIAYK
jgi:hypothetical protein